MLRHPLSPSLFPYTTLFRSFRKSASDPPSLTYWSISRTHGSRPQPGRLPGPRAVGPRDRPRSEEHTSELQSLRHLVCRLLLEKKKKNTAEELRITHHHAKHI